MNLILRRYERKAFVNTCRSSSCNAKNHYIHCNWDMKDEQKHTMLHNPKHVRNLLWEGLFAPQKTSDDFDISQLIKNKTTWKIIESNVKKMADSKKSSITNQPWLLSNTDISIIDVYEAEIIGEEGEDFIIEFRDSEMEVVEASLLKEEFKYHPEPARVGTIFGIVLYKQNNDIASKISAWPAEKYWNVSLSS